MAGGVPKTIDKKGFDACLCFVFVTIKVAGSVLMLTGHTSTKLETEAPKLKQFRRLFDKSNAL